MDSCEKPRGTRGQFLFVNALTLSRGPLLLLFMAGMVVGIYHPYPWLKWLNLALLVVSSVTDLFDGLLARKWNVTSRQRIAITSFTPEKHELLFHTPGFGNTA